jgi:hypothetical protein
VHRHVEQLESQYGGISTKTKTRLLHTASSRTWSWSMHFAKDSYMEKIIVAKKELVC